jgi:hypothetical protein
MLSCLEVTGYYHTVWMRECAETRWPDCKNMGSGLDMRHFGSDGEVSSPTGMFHVSRLLPKLLP